MATPFSDVYSRFLRKITDYRLAKLIEGDFESRLHGWLESSIPKFSKCHSDLSRRDESGFMNDVTDYEQEILSYLMVVEWLEPEVKSIMDMKNVLFNNDFKTFSTANLLKEKKDLLETSIERTDKLIVSYTFDTIDFDKFGGQ